MQEIWVKSLGPEDSPQKENGNPLQYSYLENPMNRGACLAIAQGVTRSKTWLSYWAHTHIALSTYNNREEMFKISDIIFYLKKLKYTDN